MSNSLVLTECQILEFSLSIGSPLMTKICGHHLTKKITREITSLTLSIYVFISLPSKPTIPPQKNIIRATENICARNIKVDPRVNSALGSKHSTIMGWTFHKPPTSCPPSTPPCPSPSTDILSEPKKIPQLPPSSQKGKVSSRHRSWKCPFFPTGSLFPLLCGLNKS